MAMEGKKQADQQVEKQQDVPSLSLRQSRVRGGSVERKKLGGGGGELRGMNRNQIILIIPAVYKVVWFSLSSVRWLEEGDW